jgi:hypothetical protein
MWERGGKKTVNAIHIDGPSWVSAPGQTSILQNGVYKGYASILWLGKTNKACFFFYGNTYSTRLHSSMVYILIPLGVKSRQNWTALLSDIYPFIYGL